MGRKKITIEPITDERNRHVTFNKRKSGLIKKAMELSILCNCQISFLVFNAENQLFEYCSTDPRLILQQYCKVAHLPHERLSNADYSRFDKASRGSKTGRGKKGSQAVDMGNSNSIANESSNDMSNHGMSQHTIKQEEMHMPQRRQSISGVSGFMEGHMGGQMMQQPVIQIPQQQYVEHNMAQRRNSLSYDPSQLSSQQQQQQLGVSQQLMEAVGMLTPVTPNTMEAVIMNQINQQQQQQQQEDMQQIGFHQVQQAMDPNQQMMMRSETAKRKFEQTEQEDYPETKRTRMQANLAPLQVPTNSQVLPMKRVEGPSDEQQQPQQYGENWQQQSTTSGENGEFTPLTGGFLFSPIVNNLDRKSVV